MDLVNGAPLHVEDLNPTMKVQTLALPWHCTQQYFHRIIRNLKKRSIHFMVITQHDPQAKWLLPKHSVKLYIGQSMRWFGIQ